MVSCLYSQNPLWLAGYLFKEPEFHMATDVLRKLCIFTSSRVDQMRSCSQVCYNMDLYSPECAAFLPYTSHGRQ